MKALADIVLVLNAGSSSIKYCAFRKRGQGLAVELDGQVSGIGGSPRLEVRRTGSAAVSRDLGGASSHPEALDQLLDFLREELAGE